MKKKQMFTIMILLMTIFTGFGLIIPVIPEMVSEIGAAPIHLGWLLAVYSAASFFLSPFWGKMSDRFGRRPVILTGLIGFSISFLLFGFASNNLWLMYLSRVLGGLFSGAATASAVAYVADITTEEDRTKGMGLVGMSIGLGFIFGPALGGIFGDLNITFPFFIASGLSLVTFFFALVYLRESLTVEQRQALQETKVSRLQAFTGSVKYLYVLSFFISFTLAGLESTLQFFQVERIGATPKDIGLMFAFIGIIGAIVQGGVVRTLVKKGQEMYFALLGLVLSAAGFFLILLSNSFWTATLYVSIFGVGNALLRPMVTSLITQKTTVGQGVASGFNSSMDSLGRITGPLLGTFVFQFNINLPYIIGGLLCILAISLVVKFNAVDKKGVTRPTTH